MNNLSKRLREIAEEALLLASEVDAAELQGFLRVPVIVTNDRRVSLVVSLVAAATGCEAADLKKPFRIPNHVRARFIVWWILRNELDLNFVACGKVFNRDHGSVIHGLRTLASDMDSQPATKARVEKIVDQVRRELQNLEKEHPNGPFTKPSAERAKTGT